MNSKSIRLRLSTVLLGAIVIQVILAVGLVAYLSYLSGRKAVEKTTFNLMEQSSDHVNHLLQDYLEIPHNILELNSLAIRNGTLDVDDVNQIHQAFWQQIQLSQFNSISSILFTDDQGELVGIAKDREGMNLVPKPNTFVAPRSVAGVYNLYQLNQEGELTKKLSTLPYNYDARQRTWYQTAVNQGEQTWTPVISYFVAPIATVFAVKPVYQDNELLAVLATDIFLADISSFLSEIKFAPSGQIFIIERSGELVASSVQEKPFKHIDKQKQQLKRIKGQDSQDDLTRLTTQVLFKRYDNLDNINNTLQLKFTNSSTDTNQSQTYLVEVRPFQDNYGLDWLIVTVVNQSDFMNPIDANISRISYISGLIIIVSVIFTIYKARWIMKPIFRLSETAKKMSEGIIEPNREKSYIYEIESLSQSFYYMSSQLQKLVGELQTRSQRDFLTGLFNRYYFEKSLSTALTEAINNHDTKHLVFYLDLDQFKIINDTCGHIAGDNLLRKLSAVIQKILPDSALLARLGGDEFGIIFYDSNLDDGVVYCQAILQSLQDFIFTCHDKVFSIGVSIGIAEINQKHLDLNSLMIAVDRACYAAKEAGGNCFHIHQDTDDKLNKMRSDRKWNVIINQAIKAKRFCLYQQKIEPVNIDDVVTTSPRYEILLRMISEDGKLVSPGIFIPVAERYKLMSKIDRVVVELLFEYLNNNPNNNNDTYYMVNLSGRTIGNQKFLNFLMHLFSVYNTISPSSICFEITETEAIANLNNAIDFIENLKNIGCQFALDDFGTGMSSFTYLKRLPVDFVKIDGSFVKDILSDSLDYTIVKSIQNIAQVLNIKTIAEYVENEQIRCKLKDMGIDYVQGYGVAKVFPLSKINLNNS